MAKIKRAHELVKQVVPDMEQEISRFDVGSFDLDETLLEALCFELRRMQGGLEAALEHQDAEQIGKIAHSVKGMAGTIGFPEISVLAWEIEQAQQSVDKERVTLLCETLLVWVRDVLKQADR
jgi:chemotaxis protein histidine kinase CheA